jgi:hypothetical protein
MKKTLLLSLFFSQIGFLLLLPVWLRLTHYLHPIVIVVVWFCSSVFVLLCVCWIKKEKIRMSKPVLHAVLFFYSLGLLVLLFIRPNHQNGERMNLIPFHTIHFYFSGNVDFLIAFYNIGANIGLFIPYGLYYQYVKKNSSIKQILVMAICSITLIECLQFLTKRGSLDIDDLILNVFGVILGYLVHPLFQKVLSVK